jgi:large subunit ribosomal protein L17
MFRALAAALITHEHIETTDARAKELRRVADRLVTLGKKGTLHARRQAYKFLNNHQLVQKLFDEIAPRFKDRPGGYTRLIKSRIRIADQAPMTFVRFVDEALPEKKETEKAPKTASTVESQVKAAVEEELETSGDAAASEPVTAAAQEQAADEDAGAEDDVEVAEEQEKKESKE